MKKIFKYLIVAFVTLFINISLLQAASANISVSSSTSKTVVGNTFTVTIKVSSSSPLGTWEFTPSYDTSKFKLTSGQTSVVDYGDGKTKSKSYTYKFKAIGTGSGKISVKSAGVIDYNTESKMSVNTSSKTVNVITQAQLEASYSKNNNLKSLSVEGLKLSPSFSSSTTKYTVEANSNTTQVKVKASVQDSKAKVSGTGNHKVYEGENKINVTVTAQNGSTKTYTIIVNVIDPNPIEVTLNEKKYTVVKRESNLEKVEDFESKTVDINEQKIPCLFNQLNNITLVGLKDSDGDISLYIYDKDNNTYTEFKSIKLSQNKLLPLDIDKEIDNYKKEIIKIDDVELSSLKMNDKDQYIIKARNFTTGEEDYYIYDSKTDNIVRYVENKKEDNENEKYKEKILEYKKMIVLLGVETVIIIFILVCILFSKMRKNKKRRKIIQEKMQEEKEKKELEEKRELEEKEKEEIIETPKETKKTKKKSTSKKKKKEVLKDEEERKEGKEETEEAKETEETI